MCAITGLYLTAEQTATPSMLEQLSATLQHRGPDGSGYYIEQAVGLYHKRLAIHDLSENGKQPFCTPKHTTCIVNGEIYNYIELKKQLSLRDQDICWQSTSDCEVIPYLYEHYGCDFVEQLRGMYALAIHNRNTNELILSRDPFGMKQLYYCQTDTGFYFASELRALASYLHLNTLNYASVTSIAQLHFDTGMHTAIEGIKRLLPGETLVIQDAKIKSRGFYPSKLGFIPPKQRRTHSISNHIDTFEKLFENTLSLHLQADVPGGLFLSGGIDSTCLLTMVSRLAKKPLYTYTIGFTDANTHDERNIAAQLAEQFNTQHHEIEFSEADFWELLPQAILATDDPTADYAIVPTFKLAKVAANDVKVVLSGEGGDEIFAGYGRYRSFTRAFWQKRRDLYIKGDLSRLGLLKADTKQWHKQIQDIKKACLKADYDRLYTAQTIDMQTWLPNDLLIKLDRCLMWHSLEGRTPFLDKVIAEFALTLPNHYKIRGKMGKWILREWLSKNVASYDAFAHKKGFTVPIQAWLDKRRPWMMRYLTEHILIQKISHVKKLKKMLDEPLTKHTAKAGWSLLYLALWYDIHVNSKHKV